MLRKLLLTFTLLLVFIPASYFKDAQTSVSVPARPSDYSLTVLSDSQSVANNQTITYTITYGSALKFSSGITITASWEAGAIAGSNATVNTMDYVVGSATDAYGATSPIVDTQNNKITWSVNSFPPETDNQTVTFKLKANGNYTGSNSVTFQTSVSLEGFGGTTINNSTSNTFKYASSNSSSATSTPTPTPASGSSSSSSQSASGFAIESVELRSISQSKAVILVSTNNKATVNLRYGKSALNIDKSISSLNLNTQNLIILDNLDPDTDYFFKISAKDSGDHLANSDIFTFRTAHISNSPIVSISSFIAASENTIISRPFGSGNENLIVLPQEANFEFKFAQENKVGIKKAVAIVRNKKVLGLNTQEIAEASSGETELAQVEPGIFSGRLRASNIPGVYEIYARIEDVNGNITETKIAQLNVVKKFSVLSKADNSPIEGARVLIYFLNQKTGKYEALPATAISILNPSFTDRNGEIPLVLPQSTYKALVSEIGFKDQNVEFTIGPSETDGYPTVLMEKHPVGISDVVIYGQRGLSDVFVKNTALYVDALTGSLRFFNLIAALTLLILIVLTLFALSTRTHIPLRKLPGYFIFYLHKASGGKIIPSYISGIIKAKGGGILSQTNVYLVDLNTEEIISQTRTNNAGHFQFKNRILKPGIIAMKPNYKSSPIKEYKGIDGEDFELEIEKIRSEKEQILHIPLKLTKALVGFSFEFLLFISFVLEILFVAYFGLIKTFPYLLISTFNLFIWVMYLRVKKHHLTS